MTLLLMSLSLATASVRSDAAGSYNDVLVDVHEAWTLELHALYSAAWTDGSPAAWAQFDDATLAASNEALAQMQAMPAFEGDTSLRGVLAASIQLYLDQQSGEHARRDALWSLERVRWTDVEELNAIYVELDRQNAAMDDRVAQVQQEFAATFDVVLDPPVGLPLFASPPFDPPGMPATTMALESWERADLALRFHNESIDLFNVGIDAWNAWTTSTLDTNDQRLAALAALDAPLEQARTMGPWNASTELADATEAWLVALQTQLAGSSVDIARLADRRILFPWARKRGLVLIDQEDAAIEMAAAEYDAHRARFSDLWALDPYEVWSQGL